MDSLLIVKNFIETTFSRKESCIVIHIDLEGAYDCIWHEGLIHKLINVIKVDNCYIKWLRDYLRNRTGKVSLGINESDSVRITSGVPQGAVLSPLLFNIMLSDIPTDENIQLVIYADDINIMCRDSDFNNLKENMQSYLNKLSDWLYEWKFTLSHSKCIQQMYSRKRSVPDIVLRIDEKS